MRTASETTRYDRRVLRGWALVRYGTAVMTLMGCGAAAPVPRTLVRSEPLPASENQQGRREIATSAEPEVRPTDALPPEQPSIAGVYLWCQSPTGRACALASAALGTGPKELSGIPPSVLAVEDRMNDCEEPTIARVSARLAGAFAIQPTGWRDQGGTSLDMTTIGEMYAAAGCINDLDPTLPVAKISAGDGAAPRVYLVRVWDGQTTPTY